MRVQQRCIGCSPGHDFLAKVVYVGDATKVTTEESGRRQWQ